MNLKNVKSAIGTFSLDKKVALLMKLEIDAAVLLHGAERPVARVRSKKVPDHIAMVAGVKTVDIYLMLR